MALPGFNAEAALYEPAERYELTGVPGSEAGAPAVIAQQQLCTPCFRPFPFLPGVRACIQVCT
jgi:hypothetical protein